MNFNEIFGKNVTYDDINSDWKQSFTLFRQYISWKYILRVMAWISFFNRNFNIRASIGILALKVYFLSRNRPRRFLFRFSFNRQIVNETHYVIIDSPLAREKKTSSACLKSSGLHDIFRWYTQWEIFNRSVLNLVEEKRIKKQMQCWRNIWDWKVNH